MMALIRPAFCCVSCCIRVLLVILVCDVVDVLVVLGYGAAYLFPNLIVWDDYLCCQMSRDQFSYCARHVRCVDLIPCCDVGALSAHDSQFDSQVVWVSDVHPVMFPHWHVQHSCFAMVEPHAPTFHSELHARYGADSQV